MINFVVLLLTAKLVPALFDTFHFTPSEFPQEKQSQTFRVSSSISRKIKEKVPKTKKLLPDSFVTESRSVAKTI